MQAFTKISGVAAPLPMVNVDTDMIIPKQFLKTIRRTGLKEGLFYEMRFDEHEKRNDDFVLHRAPYDKAEILVSGANFGCGSSRDTAALMLSAFGIRCVAAPSFGEIFRDNCFKAGMLPLALEREIVTALAQDANGGADFTLHLAAQTLRTPSGRTIRVDVPAFRREQLLCGADEITLTLRRNRDILAYQQRERAARPWLFLPQRQNC